MHTLISYKHYHSTMLKMFYHFTHQNTESTNATFINWKLNSYNPSTSISQSCIIVTLNMTDWNYQIFILIDGFIISVPGTCRAKAHRITIVIYDTISRKAYTWFGAMNIVIIIIMNNYNTETIIWLTIIQASVMLAKPLSMIPTWHYIVHGSQVCL